MRHIIQILLLLFVFFIVQYTFGEAACIAKRLHNKYARSENDQSDSSIESDDINDEGTCIVLR
ncbi:hypothetical protein EWB00_009887 [Schistosoma japonicum]|uniref:Uncharacterized protein n=1 Tax=Schistosoma japonicum TaxID=6182 RepID=A0A4Z2DQH9_SCHJA|nr:hypothetical protein EWB00_009887 [Schistosoma japonicum]